MADKKTRETRGVTKKRHVKPSTAPLAKTSKGSGFLNWLRALRKNRKLMMVLLLGVLPITVYFIFFCIYSWPWIAHFNTRFFTDQGDGFQNVWNVWWINKSVTQLNQAPWYTNMLHYPHGTTLVAQTLNPFNGFVAIILMQVFSLVQAFNIMVIFSFVFGGLTMFWLCYYFTKKYIPSILGGFLFTFSSYHFAHAIGHMQLVSLEWIPLFILLWWHLLKRPRYRTAIAAAVVLLLVLFCDYYYFLYCVVAAVLIFFYLWYRKDLPRFKTRQTLGPWATFLVTAGLICAPLPLALLYINSRDPLQGGHDSRLFSTDLFAPVITGGFWRFNSLTAAYWQHVKAYISESSVYLGLSVITVLIVALWKRTKIHRDIMFWIGFGILFGVMSLGPRLMVFGRSIDHAPLPYAVLEHLFPQLKLSGVPVRMMVMVIFAASIIVAMVLGTLNLKKRLHQVALVIFAVILFIELWPAPLPTNIANEYPKYVSALKQLPYGAVVDDGAVSGAQQLYNQVITDKPIAFGYISRTPTSVADKDWQLTAAILRQQFPRLCSEFKVRYYTVPINRPLQIDFPAVYRDDQTVIYDLKNSPNC